MSTPNQWVYDALQRELSIEDELATAAQAKLRYARISCISCLHACNSSPATLQLACYSPATVLLPRNKLHALICALPNSADLWRPFGLWVPVEGVPAVSALPSASCVFGSLRGVVIG